MKRFSLMVVLTGMVGFSLACGGGEAEPEVILVPAGEETPDAPDEEEVEVEAEEEAEVEEEAEEEAEVAPKMTDDERREANEAKSVGREPNAGEQHTSKKSTPSTTKKTTTTSGGKKTTSGGGGKKTTSGGGKKTTSGGGGKKSGQ